MKILIFFSFLIILSSFANAIYIETKTPHIIGDNNIVYVVSMDESDFVLELKDIDQNTLKSWKDEDLIKNSNGKYKINIKYNEYFIEGDYSLVAKDINNNIYTIDYKLENRTLWDRIILFVKGTITAVSNFF